MRLKLTLLLAGLVILGGCTSSRQMTGRDYAIMREQIRTDPEMRRAHLQACIKAWSRVDQAGLARLARTTPARASSVACQRMVRAVASGRMTIAEFKGPGITPRLASIIRG